MLGFVFFGLLAAALALEIISLKKPLKHVVISYDLDMLTSEPGEQITVSYQVTNTGNLPIFYFGVSFSFDGGVSILEDEKWREKHVNRSFTGISVNRSFFLPAHKTVKGRFHIALDRRGIYRLGRCYLEAGDLLGLNVSVCTVEGNRIIVCTAAMDESDPQVDVLGGFIGDISVRRFIMEDPSLLVGYREYSGYEPMKKISWIQSAKTGKLMVKQNDFTIDTDVAIAVNLERNEASMSDMERLFELVRTACEKLEEMKIPYAFISNGDLRQFQQGFGRAHLGAILRTIGVSGAACYNGFDNLIERCIAGNKSNRSYIVITPRLDEDGKRSLDRLRSVSDHEVCVLVAEKKEKKK